MKRFTVILFISFFLNPLYAQQKAFIAGKITEKGSPLGLLGATILLDSSRVEIADTTGSYFFETNPGTHFLDFNFVGYVPKHYVIRIIPNDTVFLDVSLDTEIRLLDEIVVSAGKYEQKLSDVVVSMDIIKADHITATNTTSIETLISQSPGIDVLDGQPRIRGGSGYSYGAGSRVMVMIDGLPILTPDAGDIKWDYLPVENISQIEIIKGASSTLYGSSALNGVINIRTAYPGNKPLTKVILFNGLYMNPQREELIWWDSRPVFTGASIYHSRKIGNLDLVCGYNGFSDDGYREKEFERRHRFNVNLLYRSRKTKGLSIGINSNFMTTDKADFFLWQDADSGAYRQNTSAVFKLNGTRINVDPYIEYYNHKGSHHSLKTRYFSVDNNFSERPEKNNEASLYYGEYKYLKNFRKHFDLTLGATTSYSQINSALYENHTSLNTAVYSQFDADVKKLKISLGIRFETYQLDDAWENSKPVFRTGINYHAAQYTFVRASFGQGYRFPSIAEKYTSTSLSSVNIFPNPELKSENGWSAEIGIKQGLHVQQWNGFLDLSVFRSMYKDMIEFTFGVYKPDSVLIPTLDYVGFKALNIGNASITGFEITLNGEGKIFNLPVILQAGYTYIYPVDLDYNANDSTFSESGRILKYRYQHSVKADIEFSWKKLSTGFTFIYNSVMKNIDQVFTDPFMGNLILPGYPEYRLSHMTGYFLADHRFAYNPTEKISISLITKNLFNKEYIGRPGDLSAPRNIALQLSVSF
jgi:outer membrane cobalamin receptor